MEPLCQLLLSLLEFILQNPPGLVQLCLVYVHSLVFYVSIHVGSWNPVGPVVVLHGISWEEFIWVLLVQFPHVCQEILVYPEGDDGIHYGILLKNGFRDGQVVVHRRPALLHLLLVLIQRMFISSEFSVQECQSLEGIGSGFVQRMTHLDDILVYTGMRKTFVHVGLSPVLHDFYEFNHTCLSILQFNPKALPR